MSKKTDGIKSRKQFVQHVVHTIERSFSDSDNQEAFIFGISGKWGEGKSTFLEDLESNFSQDVRVIRVNPWKFANDKVSFLRAFLRELNSVVPYSKFFDKKYIKLKFLRTIWRWLTSKSRKAKLKPLYDDFSRNRIDYKNLLVVLGGIILATVLYGSILTDGAKQDIFKYRWFITALFLPVALSIAKSIVTSQRSYHSIATLDGFNDIVSKILKGFKHTKIVVFVDDLDRLTGEKAVEVLDNLRTFFDKPEFAFVVAGDHIVLERHLGTQLLPSNSDLKVQKEEGRRFLKKIFNVYWRLPLPTKPELESFIAEDIMSNESEIGAELSKFVKAADGKARFSEQLVAYFDNNYRNTLRFADRVVFTFQVIKSQIENTELETSKKKYFREMLKNPLLVVRVLLLEELANPFYEKVLSKPSLFSDMEVATIKDKPAQVDRLISEQDSVLSDEQKANLRRLVADSPKFYEKRGIKVMSLIPYLYLSSDSSFGDERGLSGADFIECVKQGDADEVKAVIEQSGVAKCEAAAKQLLRVMKDADDEMAASLMTTLFEGLTLVAPNFEAHSIFQKYLDPSIVSATIEPLEEESQKNDLFLAYTSWFNAISSSIVSPTEFSRSLDADDITALSGNDTFNYQSSRVIAAWFVDNFISDASSLDPLQIVIDALNTDALGEMIPLAVDKLVENYVAQTNTAYRQLILRLLTNHTAGQGITLLKTKAVESLSASNSLMWSVARTELVEHGVLMVDDVDEILINLLRAAQDTSQLMAGLLFIADKVYSIEKVWNYMLTDRLDSITNSFMSYVGQTSLTPISPNAAHAARIFTEVYEAYKGRSEEYSILQYFRRSQWLFVNLTRIPNRVSIRNRSTSSTLDPNAKNQLLHILDSEWRR